jgi:hypothetical protein
MVTIYTTVTMTLPLSGNVGQSSPTTSPALLIPGMEISKEQPAMLEYSLATLDDIQTIPWADFQSSRRAGLTCVPSGMIS